MNNNIKVLPLPNWCKYDFNDVMECLNDKNYFRYIPIFKRNGWYFNRLANISWIEVEFNGIFYCALEKSSKMFKYELELLSHSPLLNNQIKAIRTILMYKDNKDLRKLLYTDRNWKDLRDIKRDGLRFWLEIK
jgi:hypothetical protein